MKSKSSLACEKSNSYFEDEDSEDDDSTFKFRKNTATNNRTGIFDCESSSSSSSSSSDYHAMTIKKGCKKEIPRQKIINRKVTNLK